MVQDSSFGAYLIFTRLLNPAALHKLATRAPTVLKRWLEDENLVSVEKVGDGEHPLNVKPDCVLQLAHESKHLALILQQPNHINLWSLGMERDAILPRVLLLTKSIVRRNDNHRLALGAVVDSPARRETDAKRVVVVLPGRLVAVIEMELTSKDSHDSTDAEIGGRVVGAAPVVGFRFQGRGSSV